MTESLDFRNEINDIQEENKSSMWIFSQIKLEKLTLISQINSIHYFCKSL